MDRDYFRYEESYGRPRRKSSLFGWSVTILLLTGLAFAAWLGSFYVFGQPERPESYRILKKLHKIDPSKRFELTAAPSGEFLTAKQLYERYIALSPTELGKANVVRVISRTSAMQYKQTRKSIPEIARELQLPGLETQGDRGGRERGAELDRIELRRGARQIFAHTHLVRGGS